MQLMLHCILVGAAASSYVFGEDPQRVVAAVGAVLPLAILAPGEVLRCLVAEAARDACKACPAFVLGLRVESSHR